MTKTGIGLWLLGGTAALAVTAFFLTERNRRELKGELAATQASLTARTTELAAAELSRTSLRESLQATEAARSEVDVRRTAAEARAAQLTSRVAELELGVSEARQQSERISAEARQLRESLALATLQVAQAGADEIAAYRATIAELESRLAEATAKPVERATDTTGPSPVPTQPLAVVGVGPANAFVVLAVSELARPATGQRWVISRGTESLADVLIEGVQAQHAIAQVVPGSLRGGLHPGDLATISSSP